MPIDYSKYPANWRSEIVPRILKRACNKCENCGLENHIYGYRDNAGVFHSLEHARKKVGKRSMVVIDGNIIELYSFLPNGFKLIQIVLTIAHLDHDSDNHNISDERLKALCQKCHLNYDLHRHVRKRKYGMNVFKQPTLF